MGRESNKYVVQFSGGIGSWAAARRLVDLHGRDRVTLLCANTNSEADDWLPFVEACHKDLRCELVMLDNGGRTIWDVFHEQRYLGNSRVDVCSKELKRGPLRAWLNANCDPAATIVALGFDWTEEHRLERARPYWSPFVIEAPLIEPPYFDKWVLIHKARRRGLPIPRLYEDGFEHNNCAGTCVKAGQAHWRLLLKKRPADYLRAEREELRLREAIDKDVTILQDRHGGKPRYVTLREFRERLWADGKAYDIEDWGACSCMESG